MVLKAQALAMGVAVSAGALVLVQVITPQPNAEPWTRPERQPAYVAGERFPATARPTPQSPSRTRLGVATGGRRKADVAEPHPAPPLSTHEVVARMVAMNAARTRALHAYSDLRSYRVQYDGLGDASAAMTVRVEFHQPGPKIFTIVSESGSAMLRHHVLEPLVKAESRDAVITSNDGSAIVPANYEFDLLSTPADNPEGDYVLDALPRSDRKRFLFRGAIWLSAIDFGIKRIKGKLPHSPSFWVRSATFDYRSQKIGDFWLPASNQTLAQIRFFGHATLNICFHDFVLTSISPVGPYASSGESP